MEAQRLQRATVALVLAAILGCGRTATEPDPDSPVIPAPSEEPRPAAPFTPSVAAMTAPDTVPQGTSFEVVVHRQWSCASDLSTEVRWSDDDSLIITPAAMPLKNCTPGSSWPAGWTPCVLTAVPASNAPRKHFDLVVNSAGGRRVAARVRGGVTPRARGLVQRLEVRRADGTAVSGARIVAIRATAPFDTVGTAVTGTNGRAQIVFAGDASEITVQEFVRTSGVGSEHWHPALTIRRDLPVKTWIVDRP